MFESVLSGREVVRNSQARPLLRLNMEHDKTRIIPPHGIKIRSNLLFTTRLVRVLERIRFELTKSHPGEEMDEVARFVREYPRAYRYHLACADFRLETISHLYLELHHELAAKVTGDLGLFEVSLNDRRVQRIYWDFESFLTETSIALDLLVRIAGICYKDEMPPSFNRFCRRSEPGDSLLALFHSSQIKWVNRLKDYRDCFTHYTPVDTMLSICMVRRKNGWETRCKIPSNPNEREIQRFRFPLRDGLLRFAFSVRRNMQKLDNDVALHIGRGYEEGRYPKRTRGLFFVGRRERQ
jgi:hypothetical protein